MEQMWRQALAGYGQRLTLAGPGGEREVRAFFQPVREKSPEKAPTPLGAAPVGKWLYLGPAEEELEEGAVIRWEGRPFIPIRRGVSQVGETVLYRWAIAKELEDEVRT